jgi:acylphosphatase
VTVRRRLTVRGRVQAVGFRAFVARSAQSRGVAGWAANRPDGTVEIVLEGDREAVESVVRACRDGPRGAHVTAVVVRDEPPEGAHGFEMR